MNRERSILITFFFVILAALALMMRWPIDRPIVTFFCASLVIWYVFAEKIEFFVSRESVLSETSSFDKISSMPGYATETIGKGMDALIETIKKSTQFDQKSVKETTSVTKLQFQCPDASEPVCRGAFIDEVILFEYMEQMRDIKQLFSYMAGSKMFATVLDAILANTK
jgi:hypothetical protein